MSSFDLLTIGFLLGVYFGGLCSLLVFYFCVDEIYSELQTPQYSIGFKLYLFLMWPVALSFAVGTRIGLQVIKSWER